MRWEETRRLIGEGGPGLHRMDHVMAALHAKLMWNKMSSYSLWAKFARKKYFKEGLLCDNNQSSPMWGSVVSHYPMLCNLSRWIVGKGAGHFWMDN